MKIKVCIATGEKRVNHMFQQEQLIHLISPLNDRRKTIKILRSVQGGRYWDDLAWSWVYELGIVPADIEFSNRVAEKYLLSTTTKKWEKFVRVFCPKEDTTIEIKTIDI